MKKILFLFLLILTLQSSAQSFRGGFRAGLTGSQVDGDNLSGFDKAGLTGGFMVAIPLNEFSDLAMEMLFVQKGSRRNPTKDNNLTKYVMRLNYIEVPVLFRRQLKSNFGFETGLSFGILLDNENREFDINGAIPARPDFEKYELAAHLGFRYFFNEKQSINLRYSNSVLPIRKAPGISTYNYFIRGQYNMLLGLTYEHWF
ncbi:MAG TPA: porin family protein [Bacteroidales bacterium]|nr:porin family protein [Bacteroidales bacterium]